MIYRTLRVCIRSFMNLKDSEKDATTTGVFKSSAIDVLNVFLMLLTSSIASFEGLQAATLSTC